MRKRLALALSLLVPCYVMAAPELRSHLLLEPRDADFGGLSAIIVQDEGSRALVLTDSGDLFTLALNRDPDGDLTQAIVTGQKPLYLFSERLQIDMEGLAAGPDGGVYASFENPLEIAHYPPDKSWPDQRIVFTPLKIRRINRGLEALAIDPQGRLITMPESVPDTMEGFPVYRLESNGLWAQIAMLPQQGPFLVVGADVGPDGHLYVLERAVSALGFRSRIRRIDLSDTDPPANILLETYVAQFDNLEGISVWRDTAGALRVTMVSDDNFVSVLRSELVEFVLKE